MVRICAIFTLLRLNRLEQFRDFRRNSLQRQSVESDPAVSLRRFRDGFKAGLFSKKTAQRHVHAVGGKAKNFGKNLCC